MGDDDGDGLQASGGNEFCEGKLMSAREDKMQFSMHATGMECEYACSQGQIKNKSVGSGSRKTNTKNKI